MALIQGLQTTLKMVYRQHTKAVKSKTIISLRCILSTIVKYLCCQCESQGFSRVASAGLDLKIT